MPKVSILFCCSFFIILSCNDFSKKMNWLSSSTPQNQSLDTILYTNITKIFFTDTFIDIGNVKQGKECQIVYYYKNVGNYPLMLFNVSPSCGCTIAEFSHKALLPGKGDSIIAKFDSKGKSGSYQKNIKVNCNTDQKLHDLFFKVNVLE